ncbi:retinol dehydrogenase 11-like [Onthophagus taurus]|uniref:retinol dehydrogenase 11-like n=1 Tax=Onthophagus taurus TaxID=166361 RepID=UPI000C1FFE73|nr:retinol dehydrogenase 11-like [Onthophagus taurus]
MINFLIAVFFFLICLKIYFKTRLNQHKCYKCLIGNTVVITGANAGLGFHTALDFAQRGAKIILACRNSQRAQEAVDKIIKATNNENVSYKIFDAASFKSIRNFAKEINETEEKIDILVNNVGGSGFRDERTEDGHLKIVQINHLAPFLLTHLLLGKLKRSPSARIVNIASWAGKFGRFKIGDLETYPNSGNDFISDAVTYANSKLYNILFTLELAKKLNGTNVTTNCLHPGTVNTDFFRLFPWYFREPARISGTLFFRNIEEGSRTYIYVSLSSDVKEVSGKFFDNCQEASLYSSASNPEHAKMLWVKSEELTKLSEDEKIK